MLSVAQLEAFPGHPYKVRDNEEMQELTESIRSGGLLTPVIVRPSDRSENKYEIISGHRRVRAAQKAGLTEVPAFVYAVSRDEAAVLLVDSNLHRERLLPSEKAFAYRMKVEALSHQGKHTDWPSGRVVPKLDHNRTTAQIGMETGESYKTVQRYIRLTYLLPALLDLMDESRMAFSVGVELSYLDAASQQQVLDAMNLYDCTPSYAQAVRLHKEFNAGFLDECAISCILAEEKPNQQERLRIPIAKLEPMLPRGCNSRQAEEFIVKACEHYRRYLNRTRDQSR